jgi:regulator of RNase E activity RraA
MAVVVKQTGFEKLSAEELAEWAGIPSTIIADETEGAACVDPAIRPLPQRVGFAGQALTVEAPPADISAVHHALAMGWPGAVLVIAASGRRDSAMAGEIFATCARAQGFAAIVIDGAVRDAGNLRQWSDIPVYARWVMARGPYRKTGGVINGAVEFGGLEIAPGSLVVGDDDGLVAVPLAGRQALLGKCRDHLAMEAEALKRVAAGETTVEVFGVPAPERIGS